MNKKSRSIHLVILMMAAFSIACTEKDTEPDETLQGDYSVPASEAAYFKFDTNYYKKYLMLGSEIEASIPILSGANVSDEALEMAKLTCSVIANTLPEAVLPMLRDQGIYIVIFGNTEYPDVLPEWESAWDPMRYGGGYGPNAPGASCGFHEGDVLNNRSDRYPTENIVIHEFAHAVMDFGLSKMYADFLPRLQAIYDGAKSKNLWSNTYAISNLKEYWAEGIQSYFDLNAVGPMAGDGIHNHVSTRSKLRDYDPDLYAFIHEFYGDATLPEAVK